MMLIMKNCEVKYSGKMKTKTRMIESKGRGGESWSGVTKVPMTDSCEERTSVYRETCVFSWDDATRSCLSSSCVTPSVGEGVGIFWTVPCGTGVLLPGATRTYWPLWVAVKLSSLCTVWVSIQSGYAAKRSFSFL